MTAEDDDEALQARRERLGRQLKAARPAAAPAQTPGAKSAASAWSLGATAASELVGAVVAGAGLGFGLDWLLHTKPAFTIVFFLLGVAAGIWNVIRATTPKGGK